MQYSVRVCVFFDWKIIWILSQIFLLLLIVWFGLNV